MYKLWLFKYDVVELGFRAENLMVWRNVTLRFAGWYFLLGRGDLMVVWRNVGGLGLNREVIVDGFIVVQWEFFGRLVRRFFRMSVIEWLYLLRWATGSFLVKNNPFIEKYNIMVKRLHFLNSKKSTLQNVIFNSIDYTQCNIIFISIYINISNIHITHTQKTRWKNFFQKL